MYEFIDKAMVLFLKHKGREIQNILRSRDRAAAAAAALTGEQACCGCLDLFLLEPPGCV